MRAVVQRVKEARVEAGGRRLGQIGPGLLVLLGIAAQDEPREARELAQRITRMRIFADHAGKMNLDLGSAGGQLLVVSQFTLLADTRGGRRPSFTGAAPAPQAEALYQDFVSHCRELGYKVETGEFGATMEVQLVNDGPVTIILDSRLW